MEQARRQRRDASAWRALVSGFEQSGLSVWQFCEQHGIGAASFYRWRSRLSSPRTTLKRQPPATAIAPAPRSDFLDLGPLSPSASRMDVRFELGGGIVVHLTRS
jgi:transposase-like protein